MKVDDPATDETAKPGATALAASSTAESAGKSDDARRARAKTEEKSSAVVDELLPAIMRCANRDLVDQLATRFLAVASFSNRRRLVKVRWPDLHTIRGSNRIVGTWLVTASLGGRATMVRGGTDSVRHIQSARGQPAVLRPPAGDS